jgi:hypothetical protein
MKDAVLIPYASVVVREFDSDSLESNSEDSDTGGSLVNSVSAAENDEEEAAKSTSGKSDKGERIKKSGVFLFQGGKAKFVEVATGIADDRNIAALTGIQPGDTVISGTFQTLRELSNGEMVAIDESSITRMKNE